MIEEAFNNNIHQAFRVCVSLDENLEGFVLTTKLHNVRLFYISI